MRAMRRGRGLFPAGLKGGRHRKSFHVKGIGKKTSKKIGKTFNKASKVAPKLVGMYDPESAAQLDMIGSTIRGAGYRRKRRVSRRRRR